MRRWQFGALAALGVALVLAGLIVFVLPGIVKRQTVQRVEAATGRTLAIGGISLNPFTWTVDVRDFRFSERGVDETFAAFASARIAVSPSSLFRWAPIIAEARVAAPYLRVIRTGKDAYNFSDLLRWLPRHHRLVLHDLTVTDGAIDVIDQALPVETRHELREIALTVPFVTTVASLGDRYITPHIRAVVNGSPLQAEGRLRPLPRIAEASFDVDLKGLVLPFYRAYLPEDFPVQVEEGQASAEVAVSYRAAPNEAPDLTLEGVVTLAGVKLADRTGEPFLAVKGVEVGIVRARPLAGEFALSLVAADGLEVFLWRDAAGVWSHSRFVEGASPRAVPRRKALVTVAETRLRHGRFHFADHFPPGGFTADLQEVSLDLRGYSTAPGKRGTYTLSFATPRGETGTLKGEFSPVPLATSSSIELTGAALETYSPYLASILRAEVKGGVDVAAQLDFGRPEGWKLDHVAARVRELSVPFGTTEGLRLASLAFDGGRFRQKENLLEVDEVTLADGDLRFSRNRKGTLSPSALLRPGATGPPRGKGEPAKPPLRYRIGRVSGSGINVAFADGLREKQPSFALRNVAFTLEQLSGPAVGPIPFRVDGAYGKDGSLRASGSFTPTRRELKGELALQRIPLADFNAYLPENLQMVVANGVIDAGLFVSLTATGNRLTGTFGGSAGVRSLHCLDAEGRDLLSWDALQLDQVKGSLAPFAIEIEDVALSRFDSRIVVQEDGTLNLQHLYPATPEGRWTPQPPARGKGKTVRIGTVTLQDGTVAFTDHHVAGGYTTTIYQLGGRISSLSSAEDRFADVDLRGNLENQSPLRITGQVNPLRDDLFADLKVSFSDIDLSPMTPYAGTYLGYAVDTGQLFLDAQYRIENRKLDSENRVFIDQLTLGKRIDSGRVHRQRPGHGSSGSPRRRPPQESEGGDPSRPAGGRAA